MSKLLFFFASAFLVTSGGFSQTNTFPSSGNVGIGITTPGTKLHLVDGVDQGSGYFKPLFAYNPNLTTGQHVQLVFGKANSNYNQGELNFNLDGGVGSVNNSLSLGLSGKPAIFTLKGSGNVGINTSDPQRPLHITGASTSLRLDRTDDVYGPNVLFVRYNAIGSAIQSSWLAGPVSVGGIGVNDFGIIDYGTAVAGGAGTARIVVLKSNGFVGIGATSPTARLQVDGDIVSSYGTNRLRFEANSSGKYYIGHNSANPLVFQTNNTDRLTIDGTGNVGIGTSDPGGYRLAVNGDAIFTKLKVKLYSTWPDYVFHPAYKLRPIEKVETFIQQYKHLPDVRSASEIERNGLDVGENQALLLKKIEELTLYLIEQNKRLAKLEKTLKSKAH